MKYQLAIFDLDGTILDTLQDLANSTNYALRQSGCPERTIDEVRCFVGNGILNLIKRAVPQNSSEDLVSKVFEDFKIHYAAHCADNTKEYDGVSKLFAQLRADGMKIAVVSNKADFAVQKLCKDYFDGYLDTTVGEREQVRRKPAPDSVNEVLKNLNISRKNAVYIGDSDVDIETAKNAGMPCISVNWGFRSTDFLTEHGAAQIVSTMDELYRQLSQD